jgi:hypothetical protein
MAHNAAVELASLVKRAKKSDTHISDRRPPARRPTRRLKWRMPIHVTAATDRMLASALKTRAWTYPMPMTLINWAISQK